MSHRAKPAENVRTPSPVLQVVIVSGLDAAERFRVCGSLAGASDAAEPARSEVEDETEDSGEFALMLADRLLESAHAGATGRAVIELAPETNVMEVGFVLETEFENRRGEGIPAELHDLIAAVSVRDIHRWLLSPDPAPAVDYVTAEALASQIEFATVVLLTDAADVGPEQLTSALGLLQRLNPDAGVATSVSARARTGRWPGGRGCARRLGQRMGWTRALADPDIPASFNHDVGVLVFRDPRPFHPQRLFDAIGQELVPQRIGRIARSRGLVQLATRTAAFGSWRSAGDTVSLDPTGVTSWDADAPVGQEMVFFGEHLDREQIITTLQTCLLTDDELLAGPTAWEQYADPFPAWPAHHH